MTVDGSDVIKLLMTEGIGDVNLNADELMMVREIDAVVVVVVAAAIVL